MLEKGGAEVIRIGAQGLGRCGMGRTLHGVPHTVFLGGVTEGFGGLGVKRFCGWRSGSEIETSSFVDCANGLGPGNL